MLARICPICGKAGFYGERGWQCNHCGDNATPQLPEGVAADLPPSIWGEDDYEPSN